MEAVAYIQKRFYQDFPPVSYSCFNLVIFDHSSDIGKSDVVHFLIEWGYGRHVCLAAYILCETSVSSVA